MWDSRAGVRARLPDLRAPVTERRAEPELLRPQEHARHQLRQGGQSLRRLLASQRHDACEGYGVLEGSSGLKLAAQEKFLMR